jgi:putative transposase
MLVAERFITFLINRHGKHPVSTADGGTWYPPQACKFLKIEHHLHSTFGKSVIIERTVQYLKDRTKEGFDDYFPCKRKKCKLKHVRKWLKLFVDYHNKEIRLK